MADYQKLYYVLFHAMTDAIAILQKAQQDAEELYISAEESKFQVVDMLAYQKPDDGGMSVK